MSSVRRSAGLRFQHNCHTRSGIASTLTPHRQLIDALESDLEAVESKSRRRCPNGDLSLRFGITAVAGGRVSVGCSAACTRLPLRGYPIFPNAVARRPSS
jgi:hypothetical protein